MPKKKSITQMPGDSKRQRADTNLTRAEENRLAREAGEIREEKLKKERAKAPTTAVERGLKRGMQNLKKAVGFRNLSVHAYDKIDWQLVWNILEGDLSDLVHFLECVEKLDV